jgi:hypothetical protein
VPSPIDIVRQASARFGAHLLAALVAVATSVLMTWPLARDAAHGVLRSIYYWDAYTNIMILGSRVDALFGRAPLSLYDDYYFAPLPHSIVFNENLFGLSTLFAPVYLLGKNPLLAYNLTLIASLALTVFFTYLLVRHVTGSGYAGIVSGVAFAFCPYILFEIGRIQLVATQWIPASFWFLHRAIEGGKRRDAVGFWLCILLQIGTGLYYTMFLVPLLALIGAVLFVRERPKARLSCWFGAVGIAAGVVAFLMVRPYFSAKKAFLLERSLAYAESNDGKLGFFANVHPTNLTLTNLHHLARPGHADDEIAFPGFTVLALLFVGLLVPAWRALRARSVDGVLAAAGRWSLLLVLVACVTLFSHSMLPGAVVFGAGIGFFVRRGFSHPFAGKHGLYFAVLLLAVVMFLGIQPFAWRGAPVRGLYYYFYAYFPGFNGMRKVARQAVMTSFAASVLAAFGGAWLFSSLHRQRDRLLGSALLLGALCYELRCFPHPIERVWAGDEVPKVLYFAASLPPRDLLAFAPQNEGRNVFQSDAGLMLHDYLALYHKHRFVNGTSSWRPPVTELALRAVHHLPDEGARRALLAIGTNHLVVFGDDLGPEHEQLVQELAARPRDYRRIFQQGGDSVFTLLDHGDRTLELLDTPALPAGAQPIPPSELRASSSLRPERAAMALDGDESTYWTGGRFQRPGQYFEIALDAPRSIVALELAAPGRELDLPVSFHLSAKNGAEDLGVLVEEPVLRFYRAQIFTPATFVLRIVLPRRITADILRITVAEPVPGSYFSIHELRLYGAPQASGERVY